ncbi:disintegrin and metalloproteinase domain-containing protein 19 isoform X1 [Gopherus evgoodei]|uniref:disintegrin and metalloproteinase domain-containing protein 19 isoform X1 n=1 Tax=Gopherus evgoodei TaxID=1825980 RepID=UPI0011D03060|nr:disintegrin and metalloproteinase domain-containing protein 19 isoform X1 [Gopherus evgoodei]
MPGAAGPAWGSPAPFLLLLLLLPALEPAGWRRENNTVGPQLYQEEITLHWKATGSPPISVKHPFKAEVKLTVEGRELILDVEKNEHLFAPGYTETHYTQTGMPHTITFNHTDHCFYHGVVRGLEQSSVTLSACKGLRGLIVLSSNLSYILEPVPDSQDQHLIYRSEHLRLPKGTCGDLHEEPTTTHLLNTLRGRATAHRHRVKREDLQSTKYVELLLVADYAEDVYTEGGLLDTTDWFQKNNYDLQRTKSKLVEVANYVDKFYKSLNIRIALVGLEVWTDRNKCDISENSHSTLWSFLAWRRKLLARKKHDNAQLITGMSFQGTTIGLAPLMAMCSDFQSGGVNMDHSDNPIGVAATLAHEMGHNLGMSHDSAGCCAARAEDGGCIMAAATGHPFPRVFSTCNRKELDRYLQSGGGICLSNMPDPNTLYGGKRCGNGYLEDGEECDCGEVEECNNPCCNAVDCSLKPGAECAHGTCCHQCKLMAPGTLCRETSRPCDLPEHCTGKSAFCPANFYQMDGTPCAGGRAYCYVGMCLTYEQQCLELWGPGARPAPDLCFEKVNTAGDTYGNCGKEIYGTYRKCEMRDAKCGKIQCQSSASKPLESRAVSIDTTITVKGRPIKCRGTHVYGAEESEGDMLDPGLVMTGTKCGNNHVCFEGHCRNTSIFDSEGCQKKCHGRGVCNSNKNCHCDNGWAPPFCNNPGNGGSLDSGPLPQESLVPVIAGVLVSILLLIGIAVVFCCYKWRDRLRPLKETIIPSKRSQQFGSASAPDQYGVNGHANPAFKLKTPQEHRKATGTPEIPSKPAVLHPKPAPDLKINIQQPPAFPAGHSNDTRKSPGPVYRLDGIPKDTARRIPPTRPAPPAPKLLVPQDTARPRPPQKALPANPVPTGPRTVPMINTTTLLPPAAGRHPGRHPPLAENSTVKLARGVNALKK